MGILDRIRNKSDREKSKLRFESEAARRKRQASAKAKARKDIRRAKQAARKQAEKAKARARTEARDIGQGAKEALKEGVERRTAGNVEAPESTEEVFALAGDAAQLRSPVDATLDPSPDGPMNEALATGMGFSGGGGEDSSDDGGALMDPGFVTGESEPFHDSNGTGDDEDVEENPLEFSDDFLNSGGSW